MTVLVGGLRPEHAGELFTVQRAAYLSEAQRYLAPTIPPLVETVKQIRADIEDGSVVTLGAWLGPRLVGSVRGRPAGRRMEVARFAVAPDLHGRGIGTRLLAEVELAAPAGTSTLWLTTGARSDDNLRLYRRAGYHQVGTTVDVVGITLALMEKTLTERAPMERARR